MDLRRLYYEACRSQEEALQTAGRLVVITLSTGDDPYSLEPGQIAASVKAKDTSKPTPKKK